MSFVVLNCQVVEWVDIFANPVFKNPGIDVGIKTRSTPASFRPVSVKWTIDENRWTNPGGTQGKFG